MNLGIPDRYLGKFRSVDILMMEVLQPIGIMLFALLCEYYDIKIIILSLSIPIFIIAFGIYFIPEFKYFFRLPLDKVKNYFELRHPQLFSVKEY